MKEQDEEVVGGRNKEARCYDRRRAGGGRLATSRILLMNYRAEG